ncbi:MAG: CBS domain-containing protein [Clostridia bacterium]|nr:CBS domain-containing protein [Clostridia bacterium]
MRAETFLSMYRVLEGILGQKYSDSDRKSNSVVMQYIQDAESEPVRQQLDVCREVRNLLTHNASDTGEPIIEPSQALIDQLYEIINYVQKPQPALMFATQAEHILRAHMNDRALDIMRRMEKHGYSYVPVLDGGRVQGVFGKHSVFSYVIDKGRIDSDTRIRDFGDALKTEGALGRRFMFMDLEASYMDARDAFEKKSGRNSRLAAIFITDTGDETGNVLGMLTPWDVMKNVPD